MAGEEPSNRSENGQFSKGNAGGPGRPKREVERNYLEQFKAVCGPPEWERIIKRAVEDAATGDGVARAWLSKHLVGVPIIKTSEPNTIGELLADIPYEQRDRLLEVLEREFGKGG